jgi:hypothetical protein
MGRTDIAVNQGRKQRVREREPGGVARTFRVIPKVLIANQAQTILATIHGLNQQFNGSRVQHVVRVEEEQVITLGRFNA